jgi:hypothetical protein
MKQELSTVAIDLAKKIFHLVGADTTGKILWRKRLTRNALMPFLAQLPPVLIGIEACGGRMTGPDASASMATKLSSWRLSSSSPL